MVTFASYARSRSRLSPARPDSADRAQHGRLRKARDVVDAAVADDFVLHDRRADEERVVAALADAVVERAGRRAQRCPPVTAHVPRKSDARRRDDRRIVVVVAVSGPSAGLDAVQRISRTRNDVALIRERYDLSPSTGPARAGWRPGTADCQPRRSGRSDDTGAACSRG